MTKLQMIGGGKMAEAMLVGLVAQGWARADELHVVEPLESRRAELAHSIPGVRSSVEPLAGVDAVIAVKPAVVPVVLPALAAAGVGRVLSIAAGVPTAVIEAGLGAGPAVVRAMPNTPALVGQGAAAIAGGASASDDDLAWAGGILAAVGTVVTVAEVELDAVTGLSGSGPAYIFHMAEGLIAAGIAEGLVPEVADALVRQTILGAASLLVESGEDPAVLRADVTSPGGTTAAGLAVFAEADLTELVGRVVRAATDRSRELGAG